MCRQKRCNIVHYSMAQMCPHIKYDFSRWNVSLKCKYVTGVHLIGWLVASLVDHTQPKKIIKINENNKTRKSDEQKNI